MTLKKNNLDREFVKKRIMDHLERDEDLNLHPFKETEEYDLYRDVYLTELEEVIFHNKLTEEEIDKRWYFVERNWLNFI